MSSRSSLIYVYGSYTPTIKIITSQIQQPKMIVFTLYVLFFFESVERVNAVWIVKLNNDLVIWKMSFQLS